MTSPDYWQRIVADLRDPARAEYCAHVLAAGLPGTLSESNAGAAMAVVGQANVLEGLLYAATVDEASFPYVLEIMRLLPPRQILAAYRTLEAPGPAGKDAVRACFEDTAPELVNDVI